MYLIVVAELFYITANALSSQSLFSLSNFYLNLAKYLNQEFISYNTLLAENYFMIGNYNQSKKIYSLLKKLVKYIPGTLQDRSFN